MIFIIPGILVGCFIFWLIWIGEGDDKIRLQEPMVKIPKWMDCRTEPKDDEKLIDVIFNKKRAKKVLHQWLKQKEDK